MHINASILPVYIPAFSAVYQCVLWQTMSRHASIKPTRQMNACSLYFVMSDLKTDTIPKASYKGFICLNCEGTVMTLHPSYSNDEPVVSFNLKCFGSIQKCSIIIIIVFQN